MKTPLDRIQIFRDETGDVVPEEVLLDLIDKGFFTAPASTKYHGAYEGGLFDHSYAVMGYLKWLTYRCDLKWERKCSPIIVGMFHDICKMDSYITITDPTDNTVSYKYNTETYLKGHGDKSVMMLSQYFKLTEKEIMCIRYHMGAFTDKEEWKDYTRAVNKYANVLWTHQADMLASHVQGV